MPPATPLELDFGVDWWTLLRDPAYLRDPYPELKRIRELAPIHYDPVTGIYFILGHREFGLVARAPEMGRDTRLWATGWHSSENKEKDPLGYELFREFQPQMTNANPPDHRRMRAVYESAFRPAYLARFAAMIAAESHLLLDGIQHGESADFMTAFANLLPRRVTRNMFHMAPDMDDQLAQWVAALSLIGNVIMTPEQKQQAHKALREFKEYLRRHLADFRRLPEEGFLAIAIAASAEGIMDEEESLNNLVTLIAGGTATLTLLGNGLFTLLRHPETFMKLRNDRTLLPSAIEEMLRYEPGSSMILRAAIRDFPIEGIRIPAGALAIGLVGAIHRDPTCFANPDSFDIARHPNPHFVFGAGPHICLGKAVVRMTAEAAFTALMDRFPALELVGEPTWWVERSDQRGLHHLPVLFGSRN
ncbi:MAG TPA: cytochrome P450 [Bryobacteraceae bacterium]|nr:cytochrome P450 [Bryobacteraceae bacterium]